MLERMNKQDGILWMGPPSTSYGVIGGVLTPQLHAMEGHGQHSGSLTLPTACVWRYTYFLMTTLLAATRYAYRQLTNAGSNFLKRKQLEWVIVGVNTMVSCIPVAICVVILNKTGHRNAGGCLMGVSVGLLVNFHGRPDLPSPDADELHGDSDDIAQILLDDYSGECKEAPANFVVGSVVLEQSGITERRVRSLQACRRASYLRALVAEAKVRFGTPLNTNANRVTVRRFIAAKMEGHGLRPTHINQNIDLIVEAVFVRSDRERYARRMRGERNHEPGVD